MIFVLELPPHQVSVTMQPALAVLWGRGQVPSLTHHQGAVGGLWERLLVKLQGEAPRVPLPPGVRRRPGRGLAGLLSGSEPRYVEPEGAGSRLGSTWHLTGGR